MVAHVGHCRVSLTALHYRTLSRFGDEGRARSTAFDSASGTREFQISNTRARFDRSVAGGTLREDCGNESA